MSSLCEHGVIRAAVIQLCSTADVASNVEVALRLIEEAADRGARLLVLPEKFNYLGPPKQSASIFEPLDGPVLTAMAEAARSHEVYLLAGSIWELIPGETRAYNTSVLFGPAGERLAVYRKIHMFDVEVGGTRYEESASCKAGTEVVAAVLPADVLPAEEQESHRSPGDGADLRGVILGLSICYDLRFPELYRALAELGSELMAAPSGFTMSTGRDHWQVLLRARAIENQTFVLGANQTGVHAPGFESYGRSMIVDPWGIVLAQVAEGAGVAIADLDLRRLRRVRTTLPSWPNRAPEAYVNRRLY